jgi:hypothetical protein
MVGALVRWTFACEWGLSPLPLKILPDAFDLVHAFVQHGDDTDVTVAESLPIDKVLLVAEEVALNVEGGGNRA